jgi:hypothetical protein
VAANDDDAILVRLDGSRSLDLASFIEQMVRVESHALLKSAWQLTQKSFICSGI